MEHINHEGNLESIATSFRGQPATGLSMGSFMAVWSE